MSSLPETVRRLIQPLAIRIANTVARAIVRVVDDSGNIQRFQVSALRGETLEGVERFGEWGFYSNPPADGEAEAVLVFAGGNRDHPLAIGVEHRPTRPPAQVSGVVMLYNASSGTRVTLDADGRVYVASPLEVVLDAPLVTVTSELEVSGDATIGGVSFADLVAAYNLHVHTDPQGGSTGPPVPTV